MESPITGSVIFWGIERNKGTGGNASITHQAGHPAADSGLDQEDAGCPRRKRTPSDVVAATGAVAAVHFPLVVVDARVGGPGAADQNRQKNVHLHADRRRLAAPGNVTVSNSLPWRHYSAPPALVDSHRNARSSSASGARRTILYCRGRRAWLVCRSREESEYELNLAAPSAPPCLFVRASNSLLTSADACRALIA
jgi:hypothetical protein